MVLAVIALQAAVVYLPVLQSVFKTSALSPVTLVQVVLPGMVVFAVLEGVKCVARFQARRNTEPITF
jgi:hypothetical protein